MCIAMCAAGVPLTLGVLALVGGQTIRSAYPELSLLLIALTLTAPMTAWMLVRGMTVRPTLEMTASAFVVTLALILAAAAGVGPGAETVSVGTICGFSCAAMLVVMAVRFDLYAGGHHAMPNLRKVGSPTPEH
jgi:hypothetical protein